MTFKECFENLINEVIAVCGVSREDILSKKINEEVVDARHLLIILMYEAGDYPSVIAGLMGVSTRVVHYAVQHFRARMEAKKWLRMNYDTIVKR